MQFDNIFIVKDVITLGILPVINKKGREFNSPGHFILIKSQYNVAVIAVIVDCDSNPPFTP
jgi:hypothetical protein